MADLGKRHMERFKLNVPAFVTLKDKEQSGLESPAELRTRNVCAGGALMLTDEPLKIGTEVDVDLHLAFFSGNVEHERLSSIHVSGSVIRIEPGGMAVKFDDKYQIFALPKSI